jgi:hypothetical protein
MAPVSPISTGSGTIRPFATIAQSASFSADRLAYLLYDPHRTMAKLALSRPAIEDLTAYIISLKER